MEVHTMTVSEFRKAFGQTLDTVCQGKKVTVTNHSKPWVMLAPPSADGPIERRVSAFDLRNNIKKHLDIVHHFGQECLVLRKGRVVAAITTCCER
jgi:antitoxin (DNA-binding transcriptional repressor) of toxin-antitoxin stability system